MTSTDHSSLATDAASELNGPFPLGSGLGASWARSGQRIDQPYSAIVAAARFDKQRGIAEPWVG